MSFNSMLILKVGFVEVLPSVRLEILTPGRISDDVDGLDFEKSDFWVIMECMATAHLIGCRLSPGFEKHRMSSCSSSRRMGSKPQTAILGCPSS